MASAWLGVADDGVAAGDEQLAGDRVEARSARSLTTSGEVAALGVAREREHPVVDGEQVELGEAGEEPGAKPLAAADGELVQQARHPDVACDEAAPAGPFDERVREKALATANSHRLGALHRDGACRQAPSVRLVRLSAFGLTRN